MDSDSPEPPDEPQLIIVPADSLKPSPCLFCGTALWLRLQDPGLVPSWNLGAHSGQDEDIGLRDGKITKVVRRWLIATTEEPLTDADLETWERVSSMRRIKDDLELRKLTLDDIKPREE